MQTSLVMQHELRDGQLIPYFLMASFLYYHHEISLMPDSEFDALCKRLLGCWRKVRHPHKRLVKRADLEAGSGYAIPLRKYPLMTKSAAFALARSRGLLATTHSSLEEPQPQDNHGQGQAEQLEP